MNRRTIWEENLTKIRKHNLEADIGLHRYTMEMNRFGDLVCSKDFRNERYYLFCMYRLVKNLRNK
jgi:hypothetical protein